MLKKGPRSSAAGALWYTDLYCSEVPVWRPASQVASCRHGENCPSRRGAEITYRACVDWLYFPDESRCHNKTPETTSRLHTSDTTAVRKKKSRTSWLHYAHVSLAWKRCQSGKEWIWLKCVSSNADKLERHFDTLIMSWKKNHKLRDVHIN